VRSEPAGTIASARRRARDFVLRAGGLAVLRARDRGGARIIAYHRFPDQCGASLRRQCDYLARRHRLVSLDEIDNWMNGGAPLPPNAVAVTVDDGHRDFCRVAYPIFRERNIPVTVFVTTGFLDGECWLWCDAVTHLFRQTTQRRVAISIGGKARQLDLDSEERRAASVRWVKESAKRIGNDERTKLVFTVLPELLKVGLPAAPAPGFEPLRWDEVREMQRSGVSFGGHTHTHPILSSLDSAAALVAEVRGAKERLEAQLQRRVAHFAYPNGTREDLAPETVAEVEKAGYQSAYLAEPGLNRRAADRFTLRRNMVEPFTPLPLFGRNILSGG
jgi:peptidoglycan/xylan/chitin deacetylase (PgdA/CDA1 family)